MKRVVEGETLEQWYGEALGPRLERAIRSGQIRGAQAEQLSRLMTDLWAGRPPAPAPVRIRTKRA